MLDLCNVQVLFYIILMLFGLMMHVVNADLQKLFMKDKKGIVRAYTFFKKTVGRHVK